MNKLGNWLIVTEWCSQASVREGQHWGNT